MEAKCNLLGYWWHHSICYTVLFTTPLVVITISPYHELWPSDVLSRNGPWISSVLNAGCWLTGWLLLTDWLVLINWLTICNWLLAKSESYVTTDGQSASLSWNKAPIWGLRPDFYYRLTVAGLLMWGALSDERTGLSFVYAAGPCQRSLSQVRVPWD
jgi:hypothetical protein